VANKQTSESPKVRDCDQSVIRSLVERKHYSFHRIIYNSNVLKLAIYGSTKLLHFYNIGGSGE
jgi:hypothetical protein